MGRHFIKKNPLAELGGCDALPAYLDKMLEQGHELVAVVEHAGTPHYVFRTRQPSSKLAPAPAPRAVESEAALAAALEQKLGGAKAPEPPTGEK